MESGTGFSEITVKLGQCFTANGNQPIFSALALFHAHQAVHEINARDVESAKFHSSQTSRVQHFDNGAIPQATGSLQVGQVQDGVNFVRGWDRPRKSMLLPRHFEAAERVRGDDLFPNEPNEKGIHADEQVLNGARLERCPVRGPMVTQMPMVGLDYLPVREALI